MYRGLTDGGFAADLEALGNSADFAPGVLVARLFGGLNFMLGAVMVTTKKHLAEIGGFESLADYFCDDYELGNRIASRGYRVELSRFPVDIVYPHETSGRRVSPSASLELEHPLLAAVGTFRIDIFQLGAVGGAGWGSCAMEGRFRLRGNRAAFPDGDGTVDRGARDAGPAGIAEIVVTAGARCVRICGLGGELFRAAHSLARPVFRVRDKKLVPV